MRQRHAEYMLSLAEEAEPKLLGHEQGAWLRRLTSEEDNLRTALAWALTLPDAEFALRLATSCWRFWWIQWRWSEWAHWIDAALARPGGSSAGTRAKALYQAGFLHDDDEVRATHLTEQSLTLAREFADSQGIARALSGLGALAARRSDYVGALKHFEESLALSREFGDTHAAARVLSDIARTLMLQGEYGRAAEHYAKVLHLFRAMGDAFSVGWTLRGLGQTALQQGDLALAKEFYIQCLKSAQEAGHEVVASAAVLGLGYVALEEGDVERANQLVVDVLRYVCSLDDRELICDVLEAIAFVAARQGRPARSAQLLATSETLRGQGGHALLPWERARYDRYFTLAKSQSDESNWCVAWEEGRAMTLEETFACALEELDA